MALMNETKVGLLVVVALGGLAWLSVKSGTMLSGGSSAGRELASVFTNVDGINVGTPVKMAGVKVGEVASITLQPNGTATLKFSVDKKAPLPADVAVKIDSSGIIGEKYVALVPGTEGAAGKAPMLPANVASVPSLGGASSGNPATDFTQISADLQQITGSLRKVLGNDDNMGKIQTIIDGMATFSGSLQSDSGSIISDLKVASASLKDMLAGGDAGQTKAMIANFSKVAANMANITDKLERGEGPLGQMLNGGEGGVGGLADLSVAMKDFKETMAKINGGQGTLGKLVNDPATAEKLNTALDTFGEVSSRINKLQTEINFEGTSLVGENGIGKGGAELVIRPQGTDSPHFYVGGVTADGFAARANDKDEAGSHYAGKEFGNDAKYTAQYGRYFKNVGMGQNVAVRVGLKDSTGGLGVDSMGQIAGRGTKVSADLYDFSGSNLPGGDTPHLDIKAKIDVIGKTVYGILGYDNVLNQEYGSPMVGAGVRFVDEDLKYLLGQAL